MKFESFLLGASVFGLSVSHGATNYFLLDSVSVPFDKCVIGSGGSYELTCNDEGGVDQSFYADVYDCSVSASETAFNSSTATFECEGDNDYAELDVWVGGSSCALNTGLSSFVATDACYYSSDDGAYLDYSCSSDSEMTVTAYSDSDCSTEVTSTNYDGCYGFGWIVYGGTNYSMFLKPSACVVETTTTEGPTTTDITTTGTTNTGISTSSAESTESESAETTAESTWGYVPNIDLEEYVGKYFDYNIFDIDVPLPIGICVPILFEFAGFKTTYGKVSCSSDGSSVTLKIFSDSSCSDKEATVSYTADNSTFECSGATNYAAMSVSADAGCANPIFNLYATTGECFLVNTSIGAAYTAATCNETADGDVVVTLWEYSDKDCTNAVRYQDLDECTSFGNIEGIATYVNSLACNLNTYDTTEPGGGSNSKATAISPFSSMIGCITVTMLFLVASVTII